MLEESNHKLEPIALWNLQLDERRRNTLGVTANLILDAVIVA
ncbi:hypothetical protein QUB68_12350 [Microcoleus sp. A006_D1]